MERKKINVFFLYFMRKEHSVMKFNEYGNECFVIAKMNMKKE